MGVRPFHADLARVDTLEELVAFSTSIESWHNTTHMAIGTATGTPMMDPRQNIFFRAFWQLHFFIGRHLRGDPAAVRRPGVPGPVRHRVGGRCPHRGAPSRLGAKDLIAAGKVPCATRLVGGSFGVAVLGTALTRGYHNGVAAVVRLPVQVAAPVRDSSNSQDLWIGDVSA